MPLSATHPLLLPLTPAPLPAVLFLLVLILLFGVMIWLTLYPLGFPKSLLKLQRIEDFHFKLLLLGIAALNFFAAFVLEVGRGGFGAGRPPGASPGGHGALLSSPNPISLPALAPDRPGSRLARLLPKAAPEKTLQEAFQEAGEGAEPAAAGLATPGPAPVCHAQDVPGCEIAVPALPLPLPSDTSLIYLSRKKPGCSGRDPSASQM